MSVLASGFADPVLDAQSVFRSLMNAMARPGRVQFLDCKLSPPTPLSAGAAAIALTLFDYETPVWLDWPLTIGDAADWLRFHTGAPIASEPGKAAFALVCKAQELPDFSLFSQGLEEYPERSTTLIVQVESLSSGAPLCLTGPGIHGMQELRLAPLPDDFVRRMATNRNLFPRGVDLIFVAGHAMAAMPRSISVTRRD